MAIPETRESSPLLVITMGTPADQFHSERSPGIEREKPPSFFRQVPWSWFIILTTLLFLSVDVIGYQEGWSKDKLEEELEQAAHGTTSRRAVYVAIGLGGLVALARRSRSKLQMHGAAARIILALVLWTTLSTLWSEDFVLSIRRLAPLIFLLLGALAAASRWTATVAVKFVLFSCFVYLSIGVIYEAVNGYLAIFDFEYRFAGTLYPNMQGQNSAFLFLAAIVTAKVSSRFKVFFYLIAAYGFTFLILSKSRTSLAALLIGLTVYLFLVLPPAQKGWLVLTTVLCCAILFLIVGEIILDIDSEKIFPGRGSDAFTSFSGRRPLWKACLSYASERPIIGFGYATFWTPRRITAISSMAGWDARSAHSAYLGMLLNGGIIALTLYLLLLFTAFRQSVREYRRNKIPEFAFISGIIMMYLVVGTFEGHMLISTHSIHAFNSATLTMVLAFGFRRPRNRLSNTQRNQRIG